MAKIAISAWRAPGSRRTHRAQRTRPAAYTEQANLLTHPMHSINLSRLVPIWLFFAAIGFAPILALVNVPVWVLLQAGRIELWQAPQLLVTPWWMFAIPVGFATLLTAVAHCAYTGKGFNAWTPSDFTNDDSPTAMLAINPGTGAPMIDGGIDVTGTPFGAGHTH